MKTLMNNVESISGEIGKNWITNLPDIIEVLTTHWNLKNVTPAENMTFNYVAKAVSNDNQPVILKISCDEKSIVDEKQALMYFDGNGSIRLIDYSEKYNALLLQQAIPGITLKSLYLNEPEYVMDRYVDTMKTLHNKILVNKQKYRHIADWLSALDNFTSDKIPQYLLNKAIGIRDKLLSSIRRLVFLHGDLHHENILKHGNQWLAIDPKGIIGETEFEIAAFDFMYVNELANAVDVKKIFESRIERLAKKSDLNAQRIRDWVIVRLILMAVWQIEDNLDPAWAIKLAEMLI